MKPTALLIGALPLLGAMIMLPGCASLDAQPNSPDGVLMTQDPNGNFIILIGNYSREINPVDIKVYIDGRMAVAGVFEYRFNLGVPWLKTFRFSLFEGRHTLKAETVRGEAQLEQEFEIRGKHWALIPYYYDPKPRYGPAPIPKHFTIEVSDSQPIFL